MARMDADAAGSARAKVDSELARVQNVLAVAEEARRKVLMICSSPVAYTLSLYVYIHETFIILSCYLNCGLT